MVDHFAVAYLKSTSKIVMMTAAIALVAVGAYGPVGDRKIPKEP
jgi:hypothetical protein